MESRWSIVNLLSLTDCHRERRFSPPQPLQCHVLVGLRENDHQERDNDDA